MTKPQSDANWLEKQLFEAKKEMESWSEWKRQAMRAEIAKAGSPVSDSRRGFAIFWRASHIQSAHHVGGRDHCLRGSEDMSNSNKARLYIERRPQGDYAIRRGGADRASDVRDTQREAIERARELNPQQAP